MSNHFVENTRIPLIHAKIFAVFDPNSSAGSLGELSLKLLEEQKGTWPQLSAGYSSLASIRLREVQCRGYSVWLQFNPGRIASTGARVDAQSIRERRCFLCLKNLPAPQKGILYREKFLVLCNPAPIFNEHFTISHIEHLPQAFNSYAATFLALARDLSPDLTVFYNGPRCGASAPDHIHFQAGPTGGVPVDRAVREDSRRVHQKSIRGVNILTLKDFGREVIVLESGRSGELERTLLHLIGSLGAVTGTSDEPMMNVLCSYHDSAWRVILFPRSKHRPDVYFKEGTEQVLISPAAVDMGGLIITPVERDFLNVDAGMVEGIFREVSPTKPIVEEAIERLS